MHRAQRLTRVSCVVARPAAHGRRFASVLARRTSAAVLNRTTAVNAVAFKTLGPVRFASHAAGPAPTSGKVQFNLADVGEGIAECEILKWHVKAGDSIKEFDPLCEVQSDKATVEITSRYDGVVTKLHYQKGDMAKVGSPLVEIDLGGSGAAESAHPAAEAAPVPKEEIVSVQKGESVSSANAKALATPAVRHLSKTKNIDLSKVQGTGRDGRILKEDLLAYEQGKQQPIVTPTATPAAPSPKAQPTPPPQYTPISQKPREQKQPLSGIKRVMARTMTAATQVPHFGYYDEFGIDALQQLRAHMKPIAESHGTKITYMPFFIKAASLALLRYPTLNSSLNAEMTEITIKNYHNIGVAMDTPQGLVVPNIKDVQDKSILDIAKDMQRLHAAAVSNQLSPSDMTGGTFTLSNIGTIGGTYASPVLVLPEVVIGAMGKIQKIPRYDSKGNIVPVHLLQISWSADHRVIDGASIASFSNLMKAYIEKPELMLAELR